VSLDASIIRRVRNLIPDKDAIYGAASDEYLFTDQDVEDLYLDGHSSTLYAAGLAKIIIGTSEALILKVVTNYETKTDGASLAKQFLAMGREMLDRATAELGLDALDYFAIIDAMAEDNAIMEGETGGFPIWRHGFPRRQIGYYPWGGGGVWG
jgi:hypothetical protein